MAQKRIRGEEGTALGEASGFSLSSGSGILARAKASSYNHLRLRRSGGRGAASEPRKTYPRVDNPSRPGKKGPSGDPGNGSRALGLRFRLRRAGAAGAAGALGLATARTYSHWALRSWRSKCRDLELVVDVHRLRGRRAGFHALGAVDAAVVVDDHPEPLLGLVDGDDLDGLGRAVPSRRPGRRCTARDGGTASPGNPSGTTSFLKG